VERIGLIGAFVKSLLDIEAFTPSARVMIRDTKISTYKKGGKAFTKGKKHRSQKIRSNRRKGRMKR